MSKEKVSVTVKGSERDFDVQWDESITSCRDCGEAICFGETKKGKWVPFDPPQDPQEICAIHWDTCAAKKKEEPVF